MKEKTRWYPHEEDWIHTTDENEIRDYYEWDNREEIDWHKRMNDMYNYTEDGFCDGFTKY